MRQNNEDGFGEIDPNGERFEGVQKGLEFRDHSMGWGCREDILPDIGKMIAAAYCLGINPLPLLRKTFPRYEWKFVRIPNQSGLKEVEATRPTLKRMIQASDFFWTTEDNFTLVIARRLDWFTTPEMIYGSSNSFKEFESWTLDPETAKFVRGLCTTIAEDLAKLGTPNDK